MTLVFQYENNSAGQLLAGITAVSTSCTLQSGQGSNFPTADGTATKINVTLIKSTGEREICVCKRTAGSDVLTFIDVSTGAASVNGRAQEGTSALVFEANDQVELRLTKGQVENFEEEIDALQTTVDAIDADYLTSDHNPGGANEDDHDARYFTESESWSRTQLAAAGGGAPIDAEHLTGKDAISHSELTDDEATKHRLINDSAGNGDTTELWSANKIYDQLALKENISATHIALASEFSGWGGTATPNWSAGARQSASFSTHSNTSFDDNIGPDLAIFLTTEMTSYSFQTKIAQLVGTSSNFQCRIKIWDLDNEEPDNNKGTLRETGTTRTPNLAKNWWETYGSPVEAMSLGPDQWYIVRLQCKVSTGGTTYWDCGGFVFTAYGDIGA